MATSTQRLLMLVIFMNLVTTIAMGVTINERDAVYSKVDTQSEILNNMNLNFEGDEGEESDIDIEGTFGNTRSWGSLIFSAFIDGLNPFPADSNLYYNPLEKLLITLLYLFRTALGLLLIVEVFLLIKSKKAT